MEGTRHADMCLIENTAFDTEFVHAVLQYAFTSCRSQRHIHTVSRMSSRIVDSVEKSPERVVGKTKEEVNIRQWTYMWGRITKSRRCMQLAYC